MSAISVHREYFAGNDPTQKGIVVETTVLNGAYMFWAGMCGGEEEKAGAVEAGMLGKDWACAMPPSATTGVSTGTWLLRVGANDAALSMACRLGGHSTEVAGICGIGCAARNGDGGRKENCGSFGSVVTVYTVVSDRGLTHFMEDDFALPRWSSQADATASPLSSSQTAAQTAYYAPRIHDSAIARSQSLNTRRRHHNQDELDTGFYPAYNPPNDPYQDVYYPKRTEPPRSPLRTPLLDPYSQQQQAQYSPTTTQYPYGPPQDQRPYQGHSRGLSQTKAEPGAPYTPNYPSSTPYLDPPARSTPATPLSYLHPTQSPAGYYSQDGQGMAVDPPPQKRRASGFRRVRTAHDLQPRLDAPVGNRRMGADGVYLSPLRQLTTNLLDTYHICNPQFRYESAHNPRRVLTKPSKPVHNDGYDNDDYDYILYVNDWLGTDDGHKYLILDILGQGTFGQVVKCQNMKTHEIVAVKVVKNKPAYFNQSMMEVTILEMLNKNSDPNDQHHILRLRDSFIHRSHLCLVFELLSSNLYELIKQNQFQGLSTQLVKVFMAQLLDAMTVLKEARLIHCDLKPENILLKSLQSPQIKVIDFGSACHERQTVYTYIQSRFYRSPEVLLGMAYTAAVDMWSLGCIAVELFLGLPLFPGTSEYNQLTRIIEMLGMPPQSMLNTGKQTAQFFDSYEVYNPHTNQNEKKYRLKSIEQYSREHNTNEQPGKQYFKATSLPEIINTAPMPQTKTARQGHEVEKELNNRASFIDFCQGLLNLNPVTRWTPQQARLHPFITGEKFTKPFVPDGLSVGGGQMPPGSPGTVDPKRPYGGLVPSQPKGTRAYQDAASYNHHLAQHQAYTAQQAQAQTQAQQNSFRNPYITPQQQQQNSQSQSQSQSQPQAPVGPPPPAYPTPPESAYGGMPQTYARQLSHQNSAGNLSSGYSASQSVASSAAAAALSPPGSLVPSASSYYPSSSSGSAANNNTAAAVRVRANTINHQMDPVPPALARLQHMNQDVIAGRNALTPVLNRDDAMREWERRQAGKPSAAQPYPQLEYLQQQAELAAQAGTTNWSRYQPPTSKLAHSYHPPPQQQEERDETSLRRDAVMSNVRSAAASVVISPPAQAYSGSGNAAGNRYNAPAYSQPGPPPPPPQQSQSFDGFAPMQPDQYQPYNSTGGPPPPAVRVAQPAQSVPPSFYGPGVAAAGQSGRNPFSAGSDPTGGPGKEPVRRGTNGLDTWAR
ncbi:Protein kinase [Mycena sanguinolenta]|uniref:Protein kinase n=1 Tax=Mycena sanguinolenta TaxID=230812 RepID=A0A8H6ZC74_9AGAR|nr:Protein kinase [Mycena sanguinolenta]